MTDLTSLARLSGHKASGDADEDPIIVEQLISGLTIEFSQQVRLSLAGQKLKVSECLSRIRALRSSEQDARRAGDRRFANRHESQDVVAAVRPGASKPVLVIHHFNATAANASDIFPGTALIGRLSRGQELLAAFSVTNQVM